MMTRFLVTACFVLSLVVPAWPQNAGVPRNYFSRLRAFQERPLVNGFEAYRIIISPDDSAPLSIRVEVKKDGGAVTAKRLKRRGYDYRGIAETKIFLISHAELSEVREVFRKAKLQDLPLHGRPSDVDHGDGTVTVCLHAPSWYVEQVVNGRYQRVEQYCPDDDDFIEIGYVLLKISRFVIPKEQLFQ